MSAPVFGFQKRRGSLPPPATRISPLGEYARHRIRLPCRSLLEPMPRKLRCGNATSSGAGCAVAMPVLNRAAKTRIVRIRVIWMVFMARPFIVRETTGYGHGRRLLVRITHSKDD